ncbi:hypothetical protein M408DRAFT_331652 [Serendipita vermifera MAFF 305830]|uniref:Cofilin n=1 Tax=Serendipita vermifera MAFF 305830 TaxID=933852 RepID=A0A0C3AZL9_SERVB|nr:hypothetical protein M408DRAFT_331652 [Serendipita vermifera MAFF 305830]
MSGIPVTDECVTTYKNFQLGRKVDGQKLKYIIYKLSANNREIVIDKAAPGSTGSSSDDDPSLAMWENFCEELPDDETRWAVYEFDFDLGADGKRSKIVFINWIPEGAKKKMIAASSTEAVKGALGRSFVDHQANDRDSLNYQDVLNKLKGTR